MIKRTNNQRKLKICGIRLFGKRSAMCSEMRPDYSDLACQVSGKIDVTADKKVFELPNKFNYDKIENAQH
jgi:hypothetical protein